MTFDPQAYAALQQTNPAAAASYLAAFSAPAAAPALAVSHYAPSTAAVQPQAQYQNPGAVQPPPQALARGTLEDFYNQPTGGGAPSVTSKFFNKRPQGSWLQFEVTRDVTNADVRQQTTPQGQPQVFRDGRAKFVLVVPVRVTGSSDGTHPVEFPDGEGSLWVKGVLADELRRAMTAAGDPSGYPKGGAQVVMVSAGEKASRTPGFSATKLYQLQYADPAQDLQAIAQAASGFPTATAAAPAAAPAPVPAPAPATAPAAPPAMTAPATTLPTAPPAPALAPTFQEPVNGAAPAPAAAIPATLPAAAAPTASVPDISADRAALLARLQGQG